MTGSTELPDATVRFLAAARRAGLNPEPVVYPEGTRTAAQAAAAIGCDVSAIVKSLVFVAEADPVLVLIPGDLRVDETRLGEVLGVPARRAGLDEVREHTGYAAGGTPPVGHRIDMRVLADPSLRRHAVVWAAAGTPTTVFPLPVESLIEVSGAEWCDLAQRERGDAG